MRMLRNFGLAALFGAIVGAVVATLLAPGFISWYQTPGGGAAMCDCASTARNVVGQLVRVQLVGAGIGAAASVIVGLLIVRGRGKKPGSATAPVETDKPGSPPGTGGPLG